MTQFRSSPFLRNQLNTGQTLTRTTSCGRIGGNVPDWWGFGKEKWEEMKILIAIPCMDTVYTDFMKSFVDLHKPEGTVYTVIKNSLIYNARNTIAANAIKMGFDRVMWIDSDVIFEPDTLTRLSADMDKGYDAVTGVCFKRSLPTSPVLYDQLWWKTDGNVIDTGAHQMTDYPRGKLFPVAGMGFGCCMVSVDLLKRISDRYCTPFTPLLGMGEDIAFCWRAGQVGAKIACDSGIMCGHIGTFVYNESLYWGKLEC